MCTKFQFSITNWDVIHKQNSLVKIELLKDNCLQKSHWVIHVMLKVLITLLLRLTHWGRVTHICIGNLTITGLHYGLLPGRRQAIIWSNAGILLIRTFGTNFSEILSEIHTSSFNKMHLNMSSEKWQPFCLGLNVNHNAFLAWLQRCMSVSYTDLPSSCLISNCTRNAFW